MELEIVLGWGGLEWPAAAPQDWMTGLEVGKVRSQGIICFELFFIFVFSFNKREKGHSRQMAIVNENCDQKTSVDEIT